jgi:hypothetical protein
MEAGVAAEFLARTGASGSDAGSAFRSSQLFVMAVICGVVLAGLSGVVRGVIQMPFGDVGMVAGLLMIARFMVFGGLAMVLRRVLVMLSSFVMMLRGIFRHVEFSLT